MIVASKCSGCEKENRMMANLPRLVQRTPSEDASCTLSITPEQAERRGWLWVIGAFIMCPCHLPLTLAILATLLGGTALGALLHQYPWTAGTIITIAWALGTWRGLRHIRDARTFANGSMRHGRANSAPHQQH
jgi:mercuric ion transport protein